MAQEKLEETAKDFVVKAAESAATKIGTEVASFLWNKFFERSPLSKVEQSAHDDLCDLYKEYINGKIPPAWELDDKKRPTYCSDFINQQKKLTRKLNRHSNVMTPQIRGIISLIARLFESLSKRNWVNADYRPDGIESMFLNEIAEWCFIELPHCSIADSDKIKMIEQRIEYLEIVQESVFEFKRDQKKANPRYTLASIIKELNVTKRQLEQTCASANFRDKINLIDTQIVNMVYGTINILHLMLDGIYEQEFQVGNFLKCRKPRKEEITKLKRTVLGQWLEKTCITTGIESNNFQNTNEISPKQIPDYLERELSDHLKSNLSPAQKIKTLGTHDFVWSLEHRGAEQDSSPPINYFSEENPIFLNLVIKLHRSILKLCAIRDHLRHTKQLHAAYGEIWLFGVEEGKSIHEALIFALEDAYKTHFGTYFIQLHICPIKKAKV